ncbi:LysM peptidoglycan-binding domain-containing protein [Eremococcus coleocola]|uniref:LysM peptidoglycan-binding domain-containing protein n=1 Tax=Eremococcus coleocola TaxID=88132 RepID=UPI0003F4B249|nr:LysM peptidoglycan-binding domain-containing protein [Eremococcus coleocola]
MERKLLHKRKGQWVALSTSLLAMAITMQSADFVLAQEANSSDQSLVTSQEIDEISKIESSLNIDNEKQEVTPEIDADEIEAIQSALAKPTENSHHTSNLSNQTSASHTVKQGDTLYSLARNNGLTLDQLMAYNNLSSYNIPVGTVLYFTPQAKSNSQVVANQERATTQVVTKLKSDNYSPQEFIAMIAESSKSIAKANDLYPSVMIAQAALESNWGNSKLSKAPNYNLFGVKGSYNGNSVALDTLEDDGTGNYSGVKAKFKAYPSYMQSLLDYANILTGKDSTWRREYYAGARFSNTNSYKDATAHLTGRYATDTRYGSKLNNLISMYNLTQYDQILFENSNNSNHNINDIEDEASKNIKQSGSDLPNQQNNGNQSTGTYTVKKGESLGLISRRYGMTVAQLKALNGLSSDLIHPNQKLRVYASASKPVNAETHTVQKGEYLYLISRKYGMTVNELKRLNNLTSNYLKSGQVLRIKSQNKNNNNKVNIKNNLITTLDKLINNNKEITRINNKKPKNVRIISSADTKRPNQVLIVNNKKVTSYNTPTKTTDSYLINLLLSNRLMVKDNKTHTVKQGEYLYLIASKYGLTVDKLKSINKLSSNTIHSGQILRLS